MAANDLRREYEAIVDREWGRFKVNALAFLKNNLPTASGTLGNGENGSSGSLAGDNLYAGHRKHLDEPPLFPDGVLRNSYREIDYGGWSGSGYGHVKSTALVSNSPYAYYYANGRSNSKGYHGYDFIGQTKKDLDSRYTHITGIGVYER